MRRLWLILMGAVGGGALLLASHAPAEECTLQLKRLSPTTRYTLDEYQFRAARAQAVQAQFQDPGSTSKTRVTIAGAADSQEAFKRLVKKEPAKYECKFPFRGVVKLAGQEYAFVFDAVGAKPDEKDAKAAAEKAKADEEKKKEDEKKAEKAKSGSLLQSLSRSLGAEPAAAPSPAAGKTILYNRLYFDRNRNGDLTDDPVMASETQAGSVYRSTSYSRAQFHAPDVPLEADGVKFDYAVNVAVTCRTIGGDLLYVVAQFTAAAYREGEITLEGKKRRVALIDFNSNGRYDDALRIQESVGPSGSEVYPDYGDVLLLDPQVAPRGGVSLYDVTTSENRHFVSKLASIDGKFYEVTISPSGDKLSLKPASPSLGYVTNPNAKFSALVYSDKYFLKISGTRSQPVPLPEGSWKLLNYTMEQPDAKEIEKPAADKKDQAAEKQKSSDLLGALGKSLAGSAGAAGRSGTWLPPNQVSARGTRDYKPVEVRKGETAVFPFGPPYKPVVEIAYRPGPDQVQLQMTLVGVAGERCSNMSVHGSRPSKPEFTISDPKGEVVYSGSFAYG